MRPPRLPAAGTCYEIDLEDGRSMVGQVVAARPVGRMLFLGVFQGFQAIGAPVDLAEWTQRSVTHAFELERTDFDGGAITLLDLGHAPVNRHRVPMPHASEPLLDVAPGNDDDWEVRSWDGGHRWRVGIAMAESYPTGGSGSAAGTLRETLRECATVPEEEDDCRYRVEAFFGESIPPEGAGEPSGVPAFDAAGEPGSWRTLVIQLNLNKSPAESLAAFNKLDEIRAAVDECVSDSKYGVVGGVDYLPESPQGWIYIYAHDCAPLTPLVRELMDGTKFANRYAIEEFGGLL